MGTNVKRFTTPVTFAPFCFFPSTLSDSTLSVDEATAVITGFVEDPENQQASWKRRIRAKQRNFADAPANL